MVQLPAYDLLLKSLIDTGSHVCLIKQNIALKLHQEYNAPILPCNKEILGISGEVLPTGGLLQLPISLSYDSKLIHNFIITPTNAFPGALLLGSDFFNRVCARILYDERKLKIGNIAFDLLKNKPVKQSLSFRVRKATVNNNSNCILTDKPIKLEKCSSVLYDLEAPDYVKSNCTYLIENSLEADYPIKIANCFVKRQNDNKIRVAFLNSTHEDVIIPAQTWIGLATPVEIHSNPQLINEDDIGQEIYKLRNSKKFEHLNINERDQLFDCINKNRDVFATASNPVGCTESQARIDITDNEIVNVKQFKLPQATEKEIERQVAIMLEADIVEYSDSVYNNPVFLVKKPDGSFRFVTDFRELNKKVAQLFFPLPDISDLINSLGGAKYFTIADLKSGYLNVPLTPESRQYTAFSTNQTKLQFKRLPYGMRSSASFFSCILSKILQSGLNKYLLCYVDDVILFSDTFENHISHLQNFFNLIRKGNVKLAFQKCQFAQTEVKYLGFTISNGTIKPSFDKVAALRDYPTPKRAKNVRQFLAAAQFYREFIPNLGEMTVPLTALLKKDAKFNWSKECDNAFNKLKEALTTAPVLAMPRFDLPFELHCDGSTQSIGSVLMQKINGTLHPIAFFSRKLRPNELKWAISHVEALSVLEGIRKFHYYLFARKFTIYTDHKALINIFKSGSKNARLNRWAHELAMYDFDIKYKPGPLHVVPDMLSRIPEESEPIEPISIRFISKKFGCKVTNKELAEKLSCKNVRKELLKEERWAELINYFEDGAIPHKNLKQHENFCFENDVLYYYSIKDEKVIKRLVIPKSLVEMAITLAHDSKINGHAGFLKTYFRCRSLFYFPNQLNLVKQHIAKCIACQKRKLPAHPNRAELAQLKTATEPLEIVEIDLMQMKTRSAQGNKFILLLIDNISRYLTAYPIPNKSAEIVAKKLHEFILMHGSMDTLISDKGKEMDNAIIEKSCDILKVNHLLSIAYRHQSNAHIERSIRTVRDYLALVAEQDKLNWEDSLPYAITAYNTSFHSAIKNIPHYLFYGRDHTFNLTDAISNLGPMYDDSDNAAIEMQARWKIALQNAKEFIKKQHEANKILYDKKTKEHNLQVNDVIFIKDMAPTDKQADKYKGPYRLIEFLSKHVIKAKLIGSRKIVETHTDFVKLGYLSESIDN